MALPGGPGPGEGKAARKGRGGLLPGQRTGTGGGVRGQGTERGNIRLTSAGTFVFKDPAKGPAYEAARKELCETEIEIDHKPICVAAPAEIKPAYIEALERFVEFTEGGV